MNTPDQPTATRTLADCSPQEIEKLSAQFAGIEPTATATPRTDAKFDILHMLKAAGALVKSSPLYGRFIDGTPLENDIAVWLANSQREAADFARTLERELAEAKAEVARLDGVKNQLERTGFQTVTQLADAWLNHQNTFKSQTAYVDEVEARETKLRQELEQLKAPCPELLDNIRKHLVAAISVGELADTDVEYIASLTHDLARLDINTLRIGITPPKKGQP